MSLHQLPLLLFTLENPEWLIILAIVVVLFGAGRLSTLGRDLGTGIREFKKATQGDGHPAEVPAAPPAMTVVSVVAPAAPPTPTRPSAPAPDYLPGAPSDLAVRASPPPELSAPRAG